MAKKDFRNSVLEKAKKIRIDEERQAEQESLSEGEKYILERKKERVEPEPSLGEKLLQERFSSLPEVKKTEPISEEVAVEQPQPIVEQGADPFAKVREEVSEQTEEDRISWYLEKVKDERVEVKGDILEQDLQNTPATVEQLANLRSVVTRLQTSLTSLGGGGIGHHEVMNLINANSVGVDSGDMEILIRNLDTYLDSALGDLTTDDVTEGATNLYYTNNRARSSIQSGDSWIVYNSSTGDITFNDAEIIALEDGLGQRIDGLTTDSVAEGSNLYYTDTRATDLINATVDATFLDEMISIDALSDVQINSPSLESNNVLKWNGSVWTNASLGITSSVTFKGSTDATVDTAPSADNGDLYINTTSGTADASWVGLTSVDSGDSLVYDEDNLEWRNLGNFSTNSVTSVQPGTGIEVDATDATSPVVGINQTVTDGWYYTQPQIDSDFDALSDTYLALTGGRLTGQLMLDERIFLYSPDRNIDVNFGVAGKLQYAGGTRLQWGNSNVAVLGKLQIKDGTDYAGDAVTPKIDMFDHFITNLPDPTDDKHAANKRYVDNKFDFSSYPELT